MLHHYLLPRWHNGTALYDKIFILLVVYLLMKYNIAVHSSKGGKAYAKRLREDIQFKKKISEIRRLSKGSDWIKIASKKGVLAKKIMRKQKYKLIEDNLLLKLRNENFYNQIARLCGFLSGDGHIKIRIDKKHWHHYEIKFYPDSLDVANLFVKTFKELYEKTPSITYVKNYYRVRVTSEVACRHLLNISTYDTHTWQVPRFVAKSESFKVEFLRAIFDCEASVGKKNIQFQSVNQKGIKQVQELLESLGINSKIYIYKRSNPLWSTNYILVVSRKENIKRYMSLVGFNHPLKNKKGFNLADVPERLMGGSRKPVSARTPRFES